MPYSYQIAHPQAGSQDAAQAQAAAELEDRPACKGVLVVPDVLRQAAGPWPQCLPRATQAESHVTHVLEARQDDGAGAVQLRELLC